MVDLLFWLDTHSLLPPSPTLLDLASEDNTLFPTFKYSITKETETQGLWTALSSFFSSETQSIHPELQSQLQEVVSECGIEDVFTKSNRVKVNAWLVMLKTIISDNHLPTATTTSRLISLLVVKLHWLVLLLSKNTDRIGLVWGLVISFLERIRTAALDRVGCGFYSISLVSLLTIIIHYSSSLTIDYHH